MSYTKYHAQWENFPDETTPLVADAFDHIEDGIFDVSNSINSFNVRDYGAVGDGTTDNWQAFKDTVDAADAAGGGVIYGDPTDTYLLVMRQSPGVQGDGVHFSWYGVNIGSNIHLRNLNLKTNYQEFAAPNQSMIVAVTPGSSHFSVRDCFLDGSITGAHAEVFYAGIVMSACTDWDVSYNRFRGFTSKGVWPFGYTTADGCERWRIAFNEFYEWGAGNALGVSYNTTDGLIQGNYIHDPYQNGAAESIICSGEAGKDLVRLRIINNTCLAWGDFSFEPAGATDCDIVGNVNILSAGVGGAALRCGGASWTRVRIENNLFDASLGTGGNAYGLKAGDLDASDSVTIAGNILLSGGAAGLSVDAVTSHVNLKILDNYCVPGAVVYRVATGEFSGNVVNGATTVGLAGAIGKWAVTRNRIAATFPFTIVANESIISENTCEGSTAPGSGAMTVIGIGNMVFGNRLLHAASNGTAALWIQDSTYTDVFDNHIQHATNNGIAIIEYGATDFSWIHDNYLLGGGTNPQIVKVGAASKVERNRGWYTEQRGATSVANGGTISHGLSATPTTVRASPSVSGEMVSVTALGSTTFTVAIIKNDGTAGTTQTVYWSAEV